MKQKLQTVYVIKYNLQSGKLVGAEALVHWIDDEYGIMQPEEFLPFASQCGLIADIDKWMIQHAVKQLGEWQSIIIPNFKLSLNVSVDYINEPQFVEDIKAVLEETKLDPSQLEIEILEIGLMDANDQLIGKINEIHSLGVTISIDDFGMGQSSLNYLREFPISTLKIDHSFTQELNLVPANAKMIAAILSLANALNLQVIADKVENGEDLAILKELKCEFVQGNYLNEPLTPEDFEKYMKSKA